MKSPGVRKSTIDSIVDQEELSELKAKFGKKSDALLKEFTESLKSGADALSSWQSRVGLWERNSQHEVRWDNSKRSKIYDAAKKSVELSSMVAEISPELSANLSKTILKNLSLGDFFTFLSVKEESISNISVRDLIDTVSATHAPRVGMQGGVARPSDIYLALSITELCSEAYEPDIMVGVNAGGQIISDYLTQRFKKSAGFEFCKEQNQVIEFEGSCVFYKNVSEIEKNGGHPKSILLIDDVIRTGKTIFLVRRELRRLYPYSRIKVLTLLSSDVVDNYQIYASDFSACRCEIMNIKLPYDSHGKFSTSSDVNIFGSLENNMSITDHVADLYKKDAIKSLVIRTSLFGNVSNLD